MRNVKEAIVHLIKQTIEWMSRKKNVVLPLAMIVAVVTVYSLVMPAFTLEKEEAEKQGGIDVPGVEQVNEEQNSEEKQASEEGQAAKGEETPKEKPVSEELTSKEEKQVSEEKQLITKETELTKKGKDYSVSVTVDKKAAVPEDTKLAVSEIKDKKDENNVDSELPDYDELYQKAKKALQKENPDIDIKTVKFYDISLLSEDTEVEPSSDVEVKIKSDSIKKDNDHDYHIIHFGEGEPEVLDSKAKDGEIEFTTDGFSIYAVVDGGTDENARMTLDFYNGATKIATMYVKEGDSAEELETIIYDPGAGEVATDEVFAGWILDPPESGWTTADISTAKTIAEIRQWAADKQITEGETHRLDAAICKLYKITYKDDDGMVLGMDAVPVKSSEYGTAVVPYTVNMAYSPKDDEHNFEGWKLDEGSVSNVTSPIPAERIYENETDMTIKGSVSFTVNAPKGNWFIFNENGKGATYNAPQFVKDGEVTKQPRPDSEMTRKGYRFGGWYDTKEHADAHAADPSDETGKFTFGDEINAKTTIYASWIPNTTAPYTVILWGQNLDRNGYEVLGSYVNENGRVGQDIPYTSVNNGDEDYATGVGAGNGHYTGFNLLESSKNQHVTITPEGDAVLNLYYDRIVYNFKFYLYRSGTQNNRYDYANNSGNGRELNDLVTWHSNQNAHPSVNGYTIQSEQVGGRTYYYFVMNAYYGEDISAKWPKYDQITGANGREAVSFVMMVGTKLKPNPTNQGSGTVKGVITVLNENILGATNNSNGNYVIIRFPDDYYNWRYHIWFEAVDGEPIPAGKPTHVYNGKTYYQETIQVVRSSNTTDANQNEPKYTGFDYITRMGQNAQGVWGGSHWTTSEGGTTLYHLNYIYDRQVFKISYFDGNYVNGAGSTIQNKSEDLLHQSENYQFGAKIPNDDQHPGIGGKYIPDPPEDGYVFEGWYVDEGCTTPYVWDKMPIGGIKVYAKWRQVQYRVFLHPDAGHGPDDPLDWGDPGVQTSFRVNYGEKVSTPTGTREGTGYEFVGWYTDPSCSSDSLYKPDMILNEDTVTTEYNQTEPTELDKWGDPTSQINKDAQEQRFWITKKLELYAKWRKVLEGDGIEIIYSPTDDEGNTGSNEPEDDSIYPDQADAIAQAAATAPDRMEFKYWVVQKWDSTQNKYVDTETTVLPGENFTIKEELAHKVPKPDEHDKYTYTMQLRAEYAEIGSDVPTHIWWFENYSADESATRHESYVQNQPIQVNEAVEILEAPAREGFVFLGWARITTGESESRPGESTGDKPTGKILELDEDDLYLKYDKNDDGEYVYKLNDTTSRYNGKEVTEIAADERLEYHDMYAVWKRVYKVKVIKTVATDIGDDRTRTFMFDPSKSISGKDTGDSFNLVHNGSKEFKGVHAGATIYVEEILGTASDIYDVSVEYKYVTDEKGKPIPEDEQVSVPIDNGEDISNLHGDIEMTFTNSRKTIDVDFEKTDLNSAALNDADFSIFRWDEELHRYVAYNIDDSGNSFTIGTKTLSLPVGQYKITETSAPDGYIIKYADTLFSIAADGSVTIDEEVNPYASLTPKTQTDNAKISIKNEPGKELPMTGGIGTTIMYIAGIILTMISGVILAIRTKRQFN